MTTSKLATFIQNTILVLLGLVWWGLYYLFGKIDVPMWIYKSALAFLSIYVPIMIIALVSAYRDSLHEKEDKPTQKKPVLKVYGSSSK